MNPCAPTILPNNMDMFETHTTAGLPGSGEPAPPCGSFSNPDIWFSTVVPASGELYIATRSDVLIDAAMAIYTGSCNNLELIACVEDDLCGLTDFPITSFDQLTPGEIVTIRFWANGPDGDFEIRVSETDLIPAQFITVGNATYISNECIRLTSASNAQQGCIWFPEPVDFTMPFTHTMRMSYGANDGGADGITLVYQSNDVSQCGVSGGGIGAEGILNSVIIEFDTWQNTGANDPVQDHAAVNLNGDMNHANSIAGPVVVGGGNIEDGMEYIVEFIWDPGTMAFQVTLNGTLILNGVNDLINNAFGGSTMAFWGYTASTGGANNEHIVCPGFEIFPHGVRDSIQVTICEGMTHVAGGAAQTTAGFYQDDFITVNGCDSILITELIVQPNSSFDTMAIICQGGEFNLNGESYTTADTYQQMLPSANSCDSTINIFIEVLDPIADAGIPDTLDCDQVQVQLEGIILQGADNITFEWTGPDNFTSDELEPWVELPGTYTFRIVASDQNLDCFSNEVLVEVIRDLDFEFDIEVKNTNCDSALVIITLEDGFTSLTTGPNMFQTSADSFYVFEEGNYAIDIDGASGCNTLELLPITFATPPDASIDGDRLLDCGSGMIELRGSSQDANASFRWVDPDGNELFTEDIMASIPGLYTLFVESLEGCIAMDTITLIRDDQVPDIMVQLDSIDCESPNAELVASSTNGISFAWTGPNNFNSDQSTITVMEGGIYQVVVSAANGCKDSLQSEVIVDTIRPIFESLVADTLDCNGTAALAIGSPDAVNISWVGPNGFISMANDTFVTLGGIYTATAINPNNGCRTTLDVEIFQNEDLPDLSLQTDTLNCTEITGQIVASSLTPNVSYEWSGPSSFASMLANPMIAEAGTYTVTVTGDNNCPNIQSVEVLADTIRPTIAAVGDTITCLEPLAHLKSDNAGQILSYSWTGPNNFTSDVPEPMVSDAGTYTLTVSAENTCTAMTTVEVERDAAIPSLEIMADGIITCLNSEILISSITDATNPTYSWTGPNNFSANTNNVNVMDAGQYVLTISLDNGCQASDFVEIMVDTLSPDLVLEVNGTLTCDRAQVNLTSISSVGNLSYSWVGPDGFTSDEQNISVSIPGLYTQTVTNLDNGCTTTRTIEVMVDGLPTSVDFFATNPECGESLGQLTINNVEGGTGPYEFSIDNGLTYLPISTPMDLLPDNYTLIIRDINGCQIENTFEIISTETLTLAISPDAFIVEGDSTQILLSYNKPDSSISSITWSPSNSLSCNNCTAPIAFPRTTTDYVVTVIDQDGCEEMITVRISVEENQIFVPNIFSPNADNINDFLTVFNNNNAISNVNYLKIFDRWGNQVFEKLDFPPNVPEEGWNGRFKGQHLNPGVFIYIFSLQLSTGEELLLKGDVTLVK